MQRLTIRPGAPLSSGLARQTTLLLLLSAALAGFFLLLEFVVALVSTGPRDLLATTSSQERTFGVPNGVALLEFLVLPVAVVLASAALLVSVGWPLRRASFRPTWSLALGALTAAVLIAAGAYLAFSGMLGSAVSYDEHMVQRTYLESESLVLLAAFFLSVTIAGILNWRLLAVTLVVWLAAAGVFGFLDTKPIDGLLLFPRTQFLEVPASFAAVVKGFRQTEEVSTVQPTGLATTAASTPADTSLLSQVTALQLLPPSNAPVFRVTGSVHTRYLRTSTGDSYSDGTWSQADPTPVTLEENTQVPDALGLLAGQLHLPSAAPLHEFVDHIVVSPIEGANALAAGVLPVARNLQSVSTSATYFPFSETLAVDSGVPGYQMESTLPLFALGQKIEARPVADETYLQLPDGLPPRVRELAEQVGGVASPYLKARLLQVYLQEEYAYGVAGTEEEAQPPAGQDPVDWFLFDRRAGTSGNFSSAFVVLARKAGIPARAVSGWVVARQEETQTVYRNQTHQWAEIALDGLGWVTVDPLPRDAFTDTDVDHAVVTALDELAASSVPEVRDAVAGLWNALDDPDALRLLFKEIDNAQEANARQAAQTAMGVLAIHWPIGILLGREDPLMRASAAYGLGVLADPEALDALIQALTTDEDARVRVEAVDALAILGKGRAEEPLLQALETDPDAIVREAAARALGTLKTGWTGERMVPVLLSDAAPEVRAAVALALGAIRNDVALLPLLDARSDDASPEVRAAADEALDEWDYTALLEILLTAEDPLQRAAAARLMGERRYPAASGEMVPILSSDPVPLVRAEVALALGEIRNREALLPLLDARSGDASADVRAAAAEALDEWDFDALLLILETSTNPLQRAAAARLMGERGYSHTRALQALLYALATDGSALVRAAAAYALGQAGDSVALQPLLDARSDDGSATVRNAAAEALAEWDFSALLSTLESAGDPAQRAAAAQLMGHGGYTEGISALNRALGDPAEEVRGAAREALERLDADVAGLNGNGSGTGGQGSGTGGGGTGTAVEGNGSGTGGQGSGVGDGTGGWPSVDGGSLSRGDAQTRNATLEAWARQGADVTRLENGGAFVSLGDRIFMYPDTTTDQLSDSPPIPVFEVRGAARTSYLRQATGEVYEDGVWRQLDPLEISYTAGTDIPGEVRQQYNAPTGGFSTLPSNRRTFQSLFGFRYNPRLVFSDRIQLLPAGGFENLPFRVMPTSLDLQKTDLDGVFYPFSATFSSESAAPRFSWTSSVLFFSPEQYRAAAAATDPTYTQLPTDLPDRIRLLADQITSPYDSPYAKAEALEDYLKTRYAYRFAASISEGVPPAGRDPVDWFLFDTRAGTCGQFSSAFVVMARSVGIPARVVSGWLISPTAGALTVYSDQAHQWAEVALEGIGWVRFDPTAEGGASSRVTGIPPTVRPIPVIRLVDESGSGPVSLPTDTVTNITLSPTEIRRQTPFVVGGTVLTADGQSVSGMTIEIYINETKDHGGLKIGTTTSRSGRFEAEAQLLADMELGGYQLLARAVGNDRFNESWSDPDIKVFSGNRIELSGPAEVVLNSSARFEGRLIEDAGRGVAGLELSVTFDGNAAPVVTTDASGGFSFSQSFSRLGQHWVEVEIQGEEFLLDNTARLDFEVVRPTEIEIHAPASVVIGEEFLAKGQLRGTDGLALSGKRLGVRVGRGPEQSVTTDREGWFEVAGMVSVEGEFVVSARFRGEGSVLASSGTARSAALHAVELTLEGPLRLERGEGATFQGRVASDTFSPTGQVELAIEGAGDEWHAAANVGEDGTFEYEHPSFYSRGAHTLTVHFAGGEFVEPASADLAFEVLEPTVLTLDGPTVVRDSEGFQITGTLRESGGSPVPNTAVQVVSGEPLSLTTDAEGRFAWDVQAAFDEDAAHDPHESTLSVEVVFEDTEQLSSSRATLDVAVGLPRVLVEPMEPVARGSVAVLRGTVLLGTYPVPGAELTVGPDVAFMSNDVGTFMHTYPVAADEPLGTTELVIAAPSLNVGSTTPLVVKSAANLIVTPVGRVRPGGTTLLQATLLDDTGAGIPQAVLQSSQGVDAVTDESGVAMLELGVPGTEDLQGSFVEFAYAGDDLHTPLSMPYFWEGAITPAGFNWLLWVGVPGLVAMAVAAAYTGRRIRVTPLAALARWRGAPRGQVPAPDPVDEGEGPEDDAGPAPKPVQLRIAFRKEPDLADVWGVGEEVRVTVGVADEEGRAVAGAIVDVSVGDDAPSQLAVAGNDGAYTFSWSGAETGEYPVSVEFGGNSGYLPSSTSGSLRLVDFREEIVRLYGLFLDWAKERAAGVTDQSTPREVEVILVSQGFPVPQKALDELISRFEEADYSEHPIARRHYEAMYRAWSAVVEASA